MPTITIHHPHNLGWTRDFDNGGQVVLGKRPPTKQEVRTYYKVAWTGILDDRTLADVPDHLESASDLLRARLEALWRLVEIGGPTCPVPRVVGDPRGPIRSFHVGDVVNLDGTLFVCAEVGWEPLV